MTEYSAHDPLSFTRMMGTIASNLLQGPQISRGKVHAQDVETQGMRELTHERVMVDIPGDMEELQQLIKPNLPWAEDHFQERVSGMPLNPPPSSEDWPYAQKNNEVHKKDEKFSHTYPERFWPYTAGDKINKGIRFRYGDLNNLVSILTKNLGSRQAYLPVWFPEDLYAADQGERVPCTLGYHFLLVAHSMEGFGLDMEYHMRSCDFVRFFKDDLYMAARLLQWVCELVHIDVQPGRLYMNIGSFHCFQEDKLILEDYQRKLEESWTNRLSHLL